MIGQPITRQDAKLCEDLKGQGIKQQVYLEERMLKCLHSCGPLGRVPMNHGSHQVNGIRAGIWDELLQRGG